jgi:uncharacterized protein
VPNMKVVCAAIATSLACTLVAFGAGADDAHHTFWSVKGAHNTVYLLGSVHVLKPADSDLPPEALRAYADAKALVMELDLNSVTAESLLGSGFEEGMLPESQTLAGVLGPALYGKFAAHAKSLGLDAESLSRFQPWLAAITLQQLQLTGLGFDAASGVDEQFAQRAQRDHKPIIALETMDEQLGLFAHLNAEQQRRFMQYSLDDTDQTSREIDTVVAAWRRGDLTTLASLLREDYERFPDLYRVLVTDRNRKWLPTLTRLLGESQDYLVIVGALHMVGRDGVVDLLQRAGYEVVQH